MEPLWKLLDGWGRNGYTTEAALLVDGLSVLVTFRDRKHTLESSMHFPIHANPDAAQKIVLDHLYWITK